MEHYPTIENNIPKESTKYNNTNPDWALLDNNIAAGQMDIGLSSNVCQLNLTYSYNFEDQKFLDYIAILSVLAQIAIDSSKRRYAIDVSDEIARIRQDMNIDQLKYPKFWFSLPKKHRFTSSDKKSMTKEEIYAHEKVNLELTCPMNELFDLTVPRVPYSKKIIPNDRFFIRYPLESSKRLPKRIEALIEKYSSLISSLNAGDSEGYVMLESMFDELIDDLKRVHFPSHCQGLMSWLIDRALFISPQMIAKKDQCLSTLSKNRPFLLKVLYTMNPKMFLSCFAGNINSEHQNSEKAYHL